MFSLLRFCTPKGRNPLFHEPAIHTSRQLTLPTMDPHRRWIRMPQHGGLISPLTHKANSRIALRI
jgi:hypothetical protein